MTLADKLWDEYVALAYSPLGIGTALKVVSDKIAAINISADDESSPYEVAEEGAEEVEDEFRYWLDNTPVCKWMSEPTKILIRALSEDEFEALISEIAEHALAGLT